MRKKTLPDTTPTEEDLEAIRSQVVESIVKEQLNIALFGVTEPHRCLSCDTLTNSIQQTCRRCIRAGSEASVLHQLGRRMGYKLGVPVDLLEILRGPEGKISEEELLQLNAEELGVLYDRHTTQKVPSKLKRTNFVSGNQIMDKTEVVEWKEIQVGNRPPTAREKEKALQLVEDTLARREAERDARRLATIDALIEQTQRERDRLRQEISGKGLVA